MTTRMHGWVTNYTRAYTQVAHGVENGCKEAANKNLPLLIPSVLQLANVTAKLGYLLWPLSIRAEVHESHSG